MISITGKVYLASVGGNERVFEDVYAEVKVRFIKDGTPTIIDIGFSDMCSTYIQSLGATVDYWKDQIVNEFSNNDYLLEEILENLEESEYKKVAPFVCNDTDNVGISVQKSDILGIEK